MMVEVGEMKPSKASAPVRTCVGCGKHAAREDLVRLVLDPSSGRVVVDAKGRDPTTGRRAGRAGRASWAAFGRGAHVHPSVDCISALKKGLSRSFKRSVEVEPTEVARSMSEAFARRLEGLLSGGVRAGLVAIGSDAVEEALRAHRAALVLIAADGRAKAPSDALVYGDKLRLARVLGRRPGEEREGVAVCAVTNVALATAVRRAWLCSTSVSEMTKVNRAVDRAGGAGGST